MANELSISVSGTYTKNGVVDPLPGVTSLLISITGNVEAKGVMTVNNTDTTIPLGPLASSTLGVCIIKNLDASIAFTLRVAAAGTKIVRFLPGEAWPFRIDSGITAPVLIADSGTPLAQFHIFPA